MRNIEVGLFASSTKSLPLSVSLSLLLACILAFSKIRMIPVLAAGTQFEQLEAT